MSQLTTFDIRLSFNHLNDKITGIINQENALALISGTYNYDTLEVKFDISSS
jgi:hypothetical protein